MMRLKRGQGRNRGIATGLTVVVAAGLLGAVPAVAPRAVAAPSSELRWGPCAPEHQALDEARCATIEVPLDYSNPDGRTIEITMSRLAAGDPSRRRGVIMGNPGGPGGDAIGMFALPLVPDEARDEWDLVGVQPRGLPSATPLLCDPVAPGDPARFISNGKLDRDRCERRTPGLARTLTTENTARDMEMARRALGEEKVSLFGLSYGTILMSTYATLFPNRVDRMVLDSAVDPTQMWNGMVASQSPILKARVHDMMAWIARHDSTYHLGSTPLAVYQKWSARVSQEAGVPPSLVAPPMQVGDVPPGLAAVAGQYIAGVNLTAEARAKFENFVATILKPGSTQSNSPLYLVTRASGGRSDLWPLVAAMIIDPDLSPGDLSEPQIAQDLLAVLFCNENQVPAQPARGIEALVNHFVTEDFFDGPGLFYRSGMACAGASPVTRPVQVRNRGLAVQPLHIQSVGDPQTPYRGSMNLRRQMRAHLISVEGGNHVNLQQDNPPLEAAVAEYLRTGRTSVTRVGRAPIPMPPTGAPDEAGGGGQG